MVPMVDIQVWEEECDCGIQIINHKYNEKPTASKKVLDFESAMPLKMKVTTLSQEIVRVDNNTCREVPTEDRISMVKQLVVKMKQSGYPQGTISNILESGLKGYKNMLVKQIQGTDRINRAGSQGLRSREMTDKVPNPWRKGHL